MLNANRLKRHNRNTYTAIILHILSVFDVMRVWLFIQQMNKTIMIRDQVQSEPESRTAAVSACFRDCLSHVSSKTVSDRNPNQKQQSIAQKNPGTKLPLRSPDPELSKSFRILVLLYMSHFVDRSRESSWWNVLN